MAFVEHDPRDSVVDEALTGGQVERAGELPGKGQTLDQLTGGGVATLQVRRIGVILLR